MQDVISPAVPSHVPDDWADQLAAQLTAEQYGQLIQPLHRSRVGTNPSGYSHVEAWDIRRTLIRIFGFGGFDVETLSLEQVAQIEMPPGSITYGNGGTNDKSRWTVVYRAQVRLVVKDRNGREIAHFDDGAGGDSTNQPSLGDAHDNALKTALSQALKRCAVNLGDQFGLSLYNGGGGRPDDDGYLRKVVVRSLVTPPMPPAEDEAPAIDQSADDPVQPEPGRAVAPVSAPPAPDAFSAPIGGSAPNDDDAPPAEDDPPAPASAPPASDQPTRATTREQAVNGSPAGDPPPTETAPPAEAPAKPRANPEHVFETGVAAIAAAKSSAQLDTLDKLVAQFQTDRKITDGQAGRLRLKIAGRRDELAEQAPQTAPPALADDTDGAVIGSAS